MHFLGSHSIKAKPECHVNKHKGTCVKELPSLRLSHFESRDQIR